MDSKPDAVKSCAKSREWNSRPGDMALGRSTLVQGFGDPNCAGELGLEGFTKPLLLGPPASVLAA